jgi:RNA polymerase sigma-70 factor, ECF subfamily
MDRIEQSGSLDNYHLLYAAKADLLRRIGRLVEARAHYRKAIGLTKNLSTTRYLERRIMELAKS